MANNQIKRVCVYCASSSQADKAYHKAAFELGKIFANEGIVIVCGGGANGSMGALADGAINNGGNVIGIIPKFMLDLEWAHRGIKDLIIVKDMSERKRMLIENSDAVIALPGGSGTLEELFETITLKRLGMYLNPIILLNTKNFYDPLIDLLELSISEKFMDIQHKDMWTVTERPSDVLSAISNSKQWSKEARSFATLQ
jgi:uncharacterized protein (TIGR00730 family)